MAEYKPEVLAAAKHFAEEETAFHLGFLPTEQSNPLSARVDRDFAESTAAGVRTLQRVDREVLAMARRVLAGAEFRELCRAAAAALQGGGRIVCSGCGATGRLSILLETMWRSFFARHRAELAAAEMAYADRVASIMTGGDYALIKSVESFEDFAAYGARQAADLGVGAGDLLIAITEGGETSSVLGTLAAAADSGARCFLLFNNPAALLRERLERSRRAIDDPRVTVLDLYCGPMAIAGSTRMQATTSEHLVAGAALEYALGAVLPRFAARTDWAEAFAGLLDQLEAPAAVRPLAEYVDFEDGIYREGGRITYYADDYLLDIFTDTTERSPTFMLPPFRSREQGDLAQSWAFVKNPLLPTPDTWRAAMHREPRCLEWQAGDYRSMGAPEGVIVRPPALSRAELFKFEIGCEAAPARLANPHPAAVEFSVGPEADGALDAAFASESRRYRTGKSLVVGEGRAGDFVIPVTPFATPLRLFGHLAVKLVLNTISTGVMVKQGRVAGNWMSWVSVSNKKLIDRGIRLVADLGGIDYFEACCRVFAAIDELSSPEWAQKEVPSPVQRALASLRR